MKEETAWDTWFRLLSDVPDLLTDLSTRQNMEMEKWNKTAVQSRQESLVE
jgi:hypothetical protein